MSNDIMIIRTVFEDVVDGSRNPGVRVCDDHGQSYIMWDSTPEDDMDLFFKVRDHGDEEVLNMLDFVLSTGKSIYIDQTLVPFDEIERAMQEHNSP